MRDDDASPRGSLKQDPRELRSRKANRTAALLALLGLAVVILAVAIFA